MALVHHHALEVWRQAQAQVQRFQVRVRLVALAPPGRRLVARFNFLLASQIRLNSLQSCTCSPNGSPVCSPCAPTCLTGTEWEQRRSPFQFPKPKKGGRHLFQFLQNGFTLDSGPAAGSPCIFPFKWAGVKYIFVLISTNELLKINIIKSCKLLKNGPFNSSLSVSSDL